ncbi:MAG: glycosyltransferase [bacterium]|nr:glycosyltransferase [bacterium]
MKTTGLIYILKYPEAGKVKTRLAKDLGNEVTLELYHCFIRDMLTTLSGLDCEIHIFISPPEKQEAMRKLLAENDCNFPVHPQQGNDLGERMQAAFERLFNMGPESVAIIGSDFPDLPLTRLEEAMDALEKSDAVIGPTSDGGYYLLGFHRHTFCTKVFQNMPWSTDAVFRETAARLENEGLTAAVLPTFWDVDDINDLQRFMKRNKQDNSETMRFLQALPPAAPPRGEGLAGHL